MKKYLAILISAVLLISMIAALGTSAAEPITVTHDLDVIEPMTGSLLANDTGTVNISGKSLLIKNQRSAYGLNGDPGNSNQYKATYNYSRRTKLATFADGKTLPAGTYTVSIWLYEASEPFSNGPERTEIAFSLHTSDETDDSLAYNHADLDLITLFNAKEGSRSGTPENAFAASGVTQKVGTRTWAEYTAEITVDETVSQFAFWILGDENDQGGETTDTYKVWIDNLSVYNEEGTPETTTTEATTTAATTTTAKTTAKTTVTTTVAEAVEDTTAEGESTGCKGSVGAGFAAIAVSGLTAGAVIFRKKKED